MNASAATMGDLCGLKGAKMSAEELGHALRRRFPQAAPELEKDLADCEEATATTSWQPKKALALVQALSRHSEALDRAARASEEKDLKNADFGAN